LVVTRHNDCERRTLTRLKTAQLKIMAELMVGALEDHQRIERMSLQITGGVVKATKKWKQKTRLTDEKSETHFDRFFSVNDMEFSVKLITTDYAHARSDCRN
jgi:hypothetical protein